MSGGVVNSHKSAGQAEDEKAFGDPVCLAEPAQRKPSDSYLGYDGGLIHVRKLSGTALYLIELTATETIVHSSCTDFLNCMASLSSNWPRT